MSYQDFVNEYIATLHSKDATYFKINSVMSICIKVVNEYK